MIDKVQIYYLVTWGLYLVISGYHHDKERTVTTNAVWEVPLTLLAGLPVAGRLFGWW